jgi:hypothetical protein
MLAASCHGWAFDSHIKLTVAMGGRLTTMEPETTLHWFHVTTHTYGAWLYGDPRGFRTRHHREHVEGDYKNPPPKGMYDEKHELSKNLLKQGAVILSSNWRAIIGTALKDKLVALGAQLLRLSVSRQHVHYLAKMPYELPREWTGIAKKHAWFEARDRGWEWMLWAKRSKATPVKDRKHQLNVYGYIGDHVIEGAWLWTFTDEKRPPVATGGL